MTKAYSTFDDNGGLCEGCSRPETKHQAQTTVPVFLAGGLGWGTMWMCSNCKANHEASPPPGEPRPVPRLVGVGASRP